MSAILYGLARVGRDTEIRTTGKGDAVCNVSLAFNYGRKGEDGKRPTQWVDGELWGKRAEALSPYLTKGQQVAVTLEDVHIEEYEGKNGAAFKLRGRVLAIDLAGGGEERQFAPAERPAPKKPATTKAAFSDMDDDIPF